MNATPEALLPATQRALLHRLATGQSEGRAPSMVGAVVREGVPVWTQARGLVDGQPPTADTQYRIGSLTKTFVAVLVMRPFEEGALFARVRGKPLPPFAADIDCTSWAQLFLKFIIAQPAVTCPIPATASPSHLADNLAAARGRLPDAETRRRIAAYVES